MDDLKLCTQEVRCSLLNGLNKSLDHVLRMVCDIVLVAKWVED